MGSNPHFHSDQQWSLFPGCWGTGSASHVSITSSQAARHSKILSSPLYSRYLNYSAGRKHSPLRIIPPVTIHISIIWFPLATNPPNRECQNQPINLTAQQRTSHRDFRDGGSERRDHTRVVQQPGDGTATAGSTLMFGCWFPHVGRSSWQLSPSKTK